jgi:anti-sigma regulatory factor (Ser/Thr protein kinase)
MWFDDREYKRIRLSIHPRAEFRRVLKTLAGMRMPEAGQNSEHLKYAVLEMINNSLRAHRTAGVEDPVEVRIDDRQEEIRIEVRDRGRGFDPSSLPYSLDGSPSSIDLNSEEFQDYRRRHGYQRFGMGLPLVLRTFDSFQLRFLDHEGKNVAWEPGRVKGTSIVVTKKVRHG